MSFTIRQRLFRLGLSMRVTSGKYFLDLEEYFLGMKSFKSRRIPAATLQCFNMVDSLGPSPPSSTVAIGLSGGGCWAVWQVVKA
jgi:hypothetical protein